LSDEISIEALHVDADSDGICDVTGDNCTNPETDAVKTGRGEPFQTGSGTAWGCDCNTSLDNTYVHNRLRVARCTVAVQLHKVWP